MHNPTKLECWLWIPTNAHEKMKPHGQLCSPPNIWSKSQCENGLYPNMVEILPVQRWCAIMQSNTQIRPFIQLGILRFAIAIENSKNAIPQSAAWIAQTLDKFCPGHESKRKIVLTKDNRGKNYLCKAAERIPSSWSLFDKASSQTSASFVILSINLKK